VRPPGASWPLDGFDVVGEAAGLRAPHDLRPDVVLLDVQLPDIDGLAVAGTLTATPAGPAVVLVSSRSCQDYGVQVARSSARGLIAGAAIDGTALRRVLST
jgi:DNA-binding NarL/FixJ family response regulator